MQKKKIEVPKTMNTQGINKKRVVAFMLSMLLIMQQSLTYQVLAASTITDANNNQINNGGGNTWNIRPDAVKGDTGFKQFGEINLAKGDVLNFIYNYILQKQSGTGNDLTLTDIKGDINNFIALVNNGVKIDGIVNALQGVNGALKTMVIWYLFLQTVWLLEVPALSMSVIYQLFLQHKVLMINCLAI